MPLPLMRPARPEPTGWPYLLHYQIHGGNGDAPRLRAQPGDTLWCRAHEGLHMRSGPHIHANIVGLLRIGEQVICHICQEWHPQRLQWARIRTHDRIDGWAAAGWLMSDYVSPEIGLKGLIAPPSLYAALCQNPQLLALWKQGTAFPRLVLSIAALESDVRTRAEYGGLLVSRFEESVFERLAKKLSSGEAKRQSTSWGAMQVMGFHYSAPYYQGEYRECEDWIRWLGADTAHEWIAGAHVLLNRWGSTTDDPSASDFMAIAEAYNGSGERRVALAQHRAPYDTLLAERYAQASVMDYLAYIKEDRDMASDTPVDRDAVAQDAARTHVDKIHPDAGIVPPKTPPAQTAPAPDPVPYRQIQGQTLTAPDKHPAARPLNWGLHMLWLAVLIVLSVLSRSADARHSADIDKAHDALETLCSSPALAVDCAAVDEAFRTLAPAVAPTATHIPTHTPMPAPLADRVVQQDVNLHTGPGMVDANIDPVLSPVGARVNLRGWHMCADDSAMHGATGADGYRVTVPDGTDDRVAARRGAGERRWLVRSLNGLPTIDDRGDPIPAC